MTSPTTPHRVVGLLLISLALAAAAQDQPAAAPASLKLNKGDHVAIVGNTLADRMQHHNWLETLIYARFPDQDLVFRNVSAAGDEVVTRHRSENFGTPDEWLAKVKADVIFAFFGFNESFKGKEGLDKFKSDLDKWIKDTQSKNYSGNGAPRIVLFSPVAAERHQDANFPDPAPINANLELYAAAMAEVAKANGVQFIDLFTPSKRLYDDAAKQGKSLTINGIHLGEAGDKLLAPEAFRALVGETAPAPDNLEPLRAAVTEKNWQWHGRYRTVDGYNVYGGRSREAYEQGKGGPKLTNFKVMQEEMAQRDVITTNRDKVVWAAAKGQQGVQADDSNLPPVTKVRTNKPGPNPDESHTFLSGEEAISQMKLSPGLKVNLFASEEQWPQLIKPVQMAWDTKGRLWVSVWPSYPERTPTSKTGDSLLVFEDTDGDGKADKCTPFLTDLNCPTGFQFHKDGVLVMQAPDLWFVRDTDGDGKADWKERVLMGMDSADSHHTTNSVCHDPGGAVYLSDGVFHRTQVETAVGPVRNNDAAIFRFEPRTGKFETYIPYGFANPHGRVFDYWGNDLVTDATGNNTYFGPAISGQLDYPQKHKPIKQFWERPSRPCPGTWILTSKHFPEDWWGNFLNINVISFQGIYRVKVKDEGSGLWGESLPDVISSKDTNFRPICASTGPDGALYFCDWHNPIIGHLQHHIRDPNRDHVHGRIYRITYEGRPLAQQPKIDGEPIEKLLDLLKAGENQVRELAKVELDKHDANQVMAALDKWTAALDESDPAYQHHVLEALWVHQWQNVVDTNLLNRVLSSPEPRARAAATRVLCYWRDRVPGALDMLKKLAGDPDPRVRLQAVRAASFFKTADAVDVVMVAQNLPKDYYLDYVIAETMRQIEPYWRKALAAGQLKNSDTPGAINYLVASVSTVELLKLPHNNSVLTAVIARPDVPEVTRTSALNELAEKRKLSRTALLLDLMQNIGSSNAAAMAGFAHFLPWQQAGDLKNFREQVRRLAGDTQPAEVRHPAMAAVITADQSFDPVWQAEALRGPQRMVDVLAAVPLVVDSDLRAGAYDKVKPLLGDLPPDLASLGSNKTANPVRTNAIRAAVSIKTDPAGTFAALVRLIQKGDAVTAAARGLRIVPRNAWPKDQAGNAAKALVAWAKTIPAGQRTGQEYVEAVQVAGDLAAFLPPADAEALRKELKSLRVAVFVITTVREQMRYDTPRLVVEAGKPFEIILENTDFMPHNLTVVKPSTREKIGEMSAAMTPDQLDKQGRAYIPKTGNILAATKLLEPGQKETLKVTAPKAEGNYEYVCTYPGHWEMMWGTLVVTRDVDRYLQEHPEAPQQGGTPNAAAAHEHHNH
jgi:azurin/lysophospholipase L1-like esterase